MPAMGLPTPAAQPLILDGPAISSPAIPMAPGPVVAPGQPIEPQIERQLRPQTTESQSILDPGAPTPTESQAPPEPPASETNQPIGTPARLEPQGLQSVIESSEGTDPEGDIGSKGGSRTRSSTAESVLDR